MKRFLMPLLAFCLLIFVTACSESSSPQPSSASETPAISGDVDTITEDNAEAEAEKLLKEIEGL